jgi:hypothetical protein
MAQKDSDWFIESKWERVGSMVCEAVGLRSLSTSPTGAPGAPYFLKVYGLNGPEVRGHALTCPTGYTATTNSKSHPGPF